MVKTVAYGATGELYYQGTASQQTDPLVFPETNGPSIITIDNTVGVIVSSKYCN